MSTPNIETFLFDRGVEAALMVSGLTAKQALEVLEHEYVIVPSIDPRSDDYILVGYDNRGICITLPIVPTHEPSVWRPLDGWPCNPEERDALEH